ncbi:hypothetical protein RED65_09069 [Oceanobacter sp. RED65]|uniref:Uncharacterized protein n=1 Tax=Bermanella marisrubri TaxID=207949 RepID=Q1N6R2_9GAMM|nr:hypothetical protein RED65_09069 [Oceanobacter sp. RED65] [Bermanella marisrubri]
MCFVFYGRILNRKLLIALLAFLAGINMYLDFSRPIFENEVSSNTIISILIVSMATAFPALIAYLISSKTVFKFMGVNIYKLSSDLILALSLIAWSYLLFIRERPDFYEGASHLYVATWPVMVVILALFLYLGCLLVQLLYWLYQKHNRSM